MKFFSSYNAAKKPLSKHMTKIKTSSYFIQFHLFSKISKTKSIIYNQFNWIRFLFDYQITLSIINTLSSHVIVKILKFYIIRVNYSQLFAIISRFCYNHVTISIQSYFNYTITAQLFIFIYLSIYLFIDLFIYFTNYVIITS